MSHNIEDITDKFETAIMVLNDVESLLEEIVVDNTTSYKLLQEINDLIYHVVDAAQVQGIDIFQE